jgi:hypothetical protein
MPSIAAAATKRADALNRLCAVTGGKPFSARITDEVTRMLGEASLFEMLANSFESIIGRLDKLEMKEASDLHENL